MAVLEKKKKKKKKEGRISDAGYRPTVIMSYVIYYLIILCDCNARDGYIYIYKYIYTLVIGLVIVVLAFLFMCARSTEVKVGLNGKLLHIVMSR